MRSLPPILREPVDKSVQNIGAPLLILASKSPVRRLILANAGLAFEIMPASINELSITKKMLEKNKAAADIALGLAREKALEVSRNNPSAIVIGADQTLDLDGRLFFKPKDMQAARTHLCDLRGVTHTLNSAACLAQDDKIIWQHNCPVHMTMRAFTDEQMDAILNAQGKTTLGAVGAYCFEGPAIQLFERVEGDYFSVLGLPVLPLLAGLREIAPDCLIGSIT